MLKPKVGPLPKVMNTYGTLPQMLHDAPCPSANHWCEQLCSFKSISVLQMIIFSTRLTEECHLQTFLCPQLHPDYPEWPETWNTAEDNTIQNRNAAKGYLPILTPHSNNNPEMIKPVVPWVVSSEENSRPNSAALSSDSFACCSKYKLPREIARNMDTMKRKRRQKHWGKASHASMVFLPV